MKSFLQKEIPHPGYYNIGLPPEEKTMDLQKYFSSKGYAFTAEQIAQFYTSLQTKGFVILSGISGTGKTKLGQYFAGLLQPEMVALVGAFADPVADSKYPSDEPVAEYWTYPIKDEIKSNLSTPFRLFIHHNNEIKHVFTVSEYVTRPKAGGGMVCPWPDITDPNLRNQVHEEGKPTRTFQTWMRITRREKLAKTLTLEQLQPLYDASNHTSALLNSLIPVKDPLEAKANLLFLSVRPDWRDSKGLLGYYNPLMKKYEWTAFLHFLIQVIQDFKQNGKQALPWFVILDEMNLARVEYYFADMLSVLESGRDELGWTNEPIRLTVPPEVEKDRPPVEIKLPPNLYIIGTVNVDETTHAFSPKVLDRAFTMELTDADFAAYPPTNLGDVVVSSSQKEVIREGFTRQGKFIGTDKQEIANWIMGHPEYRSRLQTLNGLLRPHDLHFGFRVFDEIITFMISAGENKLFGDAAGIESAFDAAVLMKVLPKFHGSRSKLELPLLSILAWCKRPDGPALAEIQALAKQADNDPMLIELKGQSYQYSKTAQRVIRMIVALYATGFTAFG
jgi:5-methylcytosine-specific restriction enzyme B